MNQILYVEKKLAEHKVLIIVLLLCIIFISLIFSLINLGNDKILPNVSIGDINLSNLTKEQAITQLQNNFTLPDVDSTIDIVVNGQKYTVPFTNLGLVANYEQMAQSAYDIGRSGNLITNNYKILFTYILGCKITPDYVINDDIFDKLLVTLKEGIDETKTDDTYTIDDKYITISKGNEGISLDTAKLKQDIINQYVSQTTGTITATIQNTMPNKVNLDALYTQVHKDMVNAEAITQNDTIVYKEHVDGITFKLDEAKFLYENSSEQTIKIPLIITKATVTTDQVIDNGFKDTLATYTTKYKESEKNRTVNVKQAAKNINGTILMPGQEFSFNKTVGERTTANGFKVATVYSANQLAQGIGGGICQVSSTLYNSVLLADLNIVERKNHQLTVAYVPLGQDATVAYGSIDFRFTNSRTQPIKIEAEGKNGVLTISILGTKEASDKGKEIVIKTVTNSSKAYTTKKINDNTMNEGKQLVVQNGAYGYTVSVYKIVKADGVEISNTFLHKDTYNPLQKIVKVGTKQTTIEPTQPQQPDDTNVTPSQPNDNNNVEPEPILPPGWDVPENNL